MITIGLDVILVNYWLLTALAWEVMHSPMSVCPSICFHSIFGNDWLLTLNVCVPVGHDSSLQGIEGQGRGSD